MAVKVFTTVTTYQKFDNRALKKFEMDKPFVYIYVGGNHKNKLSNENHSDWSRANIIQMIPVNYWERLKILHLIWEMKALIQFTLYLLIAF